MQPITDVSSSRLEIVDIGDDPAGLLDKDLAVFGWFGTTWWYARTASRPTALPTQEPAG